MTCASQADSCAVMLAFLSCSWTARQKSVSLHRLSWKGILSTGDVAPFDTTIHKSSGGEISWRFVEAELWGVGKLEGQQPWPSQHREWPHWGVAVSRTERRRGNSSRRWVQWNIETDFGFDGRLNTILLISWSTHCVALLGVWVWAILFLLPHSV